jgi:arabinogalactan endo-1,4-beta-galactosidase
MVTMLLYVMSGMASSPDRTPVFYLGADLSYVNEMDDCGAIYRENGQARDAFELFAERGANLVRVRLWNDPDWTAYSDLNDVKRTITRSRRAGMQVLLDFHYSDDWADGDKQIIPRAWAEIGSNDELAHQLYQFTLKTLLELHTDGLLPELVQVGNETNPEIMRGADNGKDPINWRRNALLFNAGIRAVRDASTQTGQPIKVMLHIAQPENVQAWFEAASQAGVNDRYPATEIILVETAYPWTLDTADEAANLLTENTLIEGYPATPQGQAQYLIDLTQRVKDAGGHGMVYWEPAWVSTRCSTRWGQGSHWENATFFDFNNNNEVLPAIDFLNHNYTLSRDRH